MLASLLKGEITMKFILMIFTIVFALSCNGTKSGSNGTKDASQRGLSPAKRDQVIDSHPDLKAICNIRGENKVLFLNPSLSFGGYSLLESSGVGSEFTTMFVQTRNGQNLIFNGQFKLESMNPITFTTLPKRFGNDEVSGQFIINDNKEGSLAVIENSNANKEHINLRLFDCLTF